MNASTRGALLAKIYYKKKSSIQETKNVKKWKKCLKKKKKCAFSFTNNAKTNILSTQYRCKMFKKCEKYYNFPSYLGCLAPSAPPPSPPEPPPPAHAYGLTETDDVVKTVSYLFLLGISKDHNSGEKLIICKGSEFSCSQVSFFFFFYLFIYSSGKCVENDNRLREF